MNPIDAAIAELERTTQRVLVLVDKTPDEKLFWKPSPSSRSIGAIVAHAAHALENIAMQLQGTPFPILASAEANAHFLAHDATFSEREPLVRYFEAARDGYIACLNSFQRDDLDRLVMMPFGLGEAPLRYFMTAGNQHTQSHIPQIEYIQTLYGDHDWHSGF